MRRRASNSRHETLGILFEEHLELFVELGVFFLELSVGVKVFLAVVAASAGILAGVLGNELSKNVVYFFRGPRPTGRPPTKRPVRVWGLFFVAALVFVLGSVLVAFSPTRRPTPEVTVIDNGLGSQSSMPTSTQVPTTVIPTSMPTSTQVPTAVIPTS